MVNLEKAAGGFDFRNGDNAPGFDEGEWAQEQGVPPDSDVVAWAADGADAQVDARWLSVEGQVKEKSHWCQLLKDLSEKFKALNSEHQIILKESEKDEKCLSDATQMTTTVHQYGMHVVIRDELLRLSINCYS